MALSAAAYRRIRLRVGYRGSEQSPWPRRITLFLLVIDSVPAPKCQGRVAIPAASSEDKVVHRGCSRPTALMFFPTPRRRP